MPLPAALWVIIWFGFGCGMLKKGTSHPTEIDDSRQFTTLYTKKLGVKVPPNSNRALVEQVSFWLGVPYKYGGITTKGIDCSGLIFNIYATVYKKPVARTTAALQQQAAKIQPSQLKQGDLVFFKISSKNADHAGMYLWNDYFLHASTSRGVIISSLSEEYWKKYLFTAGRLL